MTPDILIQEYLKLDAWCDAESKRFAEHLKPHKARLDEIKSTLLGMLTQQKLNSFPTDQGTAYISTLLTPKVVDRDKYLDFINENWESVGGEMLQISAPNKESLKVWLEEHDNNAPPGVEISFFNRVNIKRS